MILGLLLFVGAAFSQNNQYILKGLLPDSSYNGFTVSLQSLDNQKLSSITVAETTVRDGKFSLIEEPSEVPDMRILVVTNGNEEQERYSFFIAEPGTIEISFTDTGAVVTGGDYNTQHESFEKILGGYHSEFAQLEAMAKQAMAEESMTQEMADAMTLKARGIMSQINKQIFRYTKENLQNAVGEFYFLSYAPQFSFSQLKELYEELRPSFRQLSTVEQIMQQQVWSQDGLVEGSKFKGMDIKNLEGKTQNIDDYIGKGKVVLVDFWASWCRPCLQEMPSLVGLYNSYKDQGFEIVGISLDDSADNWKQAVKTMDMTWPQFLGEGGWKSDVARQYGINRIPQTFLLDGEGNIVARDLRGIVLEAKVKELLEK